MQKQQRSDRRRRTRMLIQAGGIVHKSGLLDAFLIAPEDDLQNYENLHKAAKLLGFLHACFEKNSFDEAHFERWQRIGERLLKS